MIGDAIDMLLYECINIYIYMLMHKICKQRGVPTLNAQMQTNHTRKLACTLIQFPLVRPCYLASCSASMNIDLHIRAYSFKDVYLRAWTCIYTVYKFQLC